MDSERVKLLVKARNKLLTELESAAGRDVAALVRELRATLREIDDLTPSREVSKLDELAARRQARIAGAAGKAGAIG